jgi:uncharacterized protein DUF4136
MLRLARSAALAVVTLTLTGCATAMTVSSHVDRGIDFTRYHSYDWGPADALPTGDARLDKDPFFQDHVQGEVEKALAARGVAGPTSATPDLLIHYHASINERLNVNRVDSNYGYCYDNCAPETSAYEAGTLVLDIVDARTNRVIWRGWAQDSVEEVLNNQDRMAKKIHEAVTRMLATLPPKL